VVEKDDVTLLFRVSGVKGRNGPPCVVEKDDIILLFRVSGVRGEMVHLAW
jgi:hypothetical protein